MGRDVSAATLRHLKLMVDCIMVFTCLQHLLNIYYVPGNGQTGANLDMVKHRYKGHGQRQAALTCWRKDQRDGYEAERTACSRLSPFIISLLGDLNTFTKVTTKGELPGPKGLPS